MKSTGLDFFSCASFARRLIGVFAFGLFAFSSEAEILSERVNGTVWNYSISNDVATVEPRIISAMESAYEGDLAIPATLGGAPVRHVATMAFGYSRNLRSVVVPEGVTTIGFYAFYASTINSISLPDSLEEIDNGCFCRCNGPGLEKIVIPANVRRIGRAAFNETEFLRTIDVAGENVWYRSVDGVLYNKDLTGLVAVPARKTSLRIPPTVQEIGDYAISGINEMEAVEIPPSVRMIGRFAFEPGFYSVRSPRVVFLGDCPLTADDAFWCYAGDPIPGVSVLRGTHGWDCVIPGTWKGVAIDWLPAPQDQIGDWLATATSRSPARRVFGRSVALRDGGTHLEFDGQSFSAPRHYVFLLDETDGGTMLSAAIAPEEFRCSGFESSSAASGDEVSLATVESVVGFRYRIESSTSADFRGTLDRTPFVDGNGRPLVLTAPKNGPCRFYRLDIAD